ncbi:hypothetical protein P280DRAFT_469266 [Massarina eburnea CBS 473.64]|uniref:Uncharacterized protein n=1 Tax=Massarina eburnea CBS 473.64 TaxID=1395130 RepID=A0A6A6RZ59_9PLEO|nr:hypothetical protein P280DRAFT_469266 [Massarina eburnea CBS 473.64]
MKFFIASSLLGCSLALVVSHPHQRPTNTSNSAELNKPIHTTALMAGVAWTLSQEAATKTRVPDASSTSAGMPKEPGEL